MLDELDIGLPLNERSNLADWDTARRLAIASRGIAGYLMVFVRGATRIALRKGRERLDHDLLAEGFHEYAGGKTRGITNPFLSEVELSLALPTAAVATNSTATNRRSQPRKR